MIDLKKENIYCRGGRELAIILEKIQSEGIAEVRPNKSHWTKTTYAFAYSPTRKDGSISYSSYTSYYKNEWHYQEVTPEIFSTIWLGYNCLADNSFIQEKSLVLQTFEIKL